MTGEQYAAFLRESGQGTAQEIARYAASRCVNPDRPTEASIRAIREILAQGRFATRVPLTILPRGTSQ
jgi:hypothetical protein